MDNRERRRHDGENGRSGECFPLLPLRDSVVFPNVGHPLFVGRERSVNAIEEAMRQHKSLVLAAQKNSETANPAPEDIFDVGTIATIHQLSRLPDGSVKIFVEGRQRAAIKRFHIAADLLTVEAEPISEQVEDGKEVDALVLAVQGAFSSYAKINRSVLPEVAAAVSAMHDPSRLADFVGSQLKLKLQDKQLLLETASPSERLNKVLAYVSAELEILDVEKTIRQRVKKQMEHSQKETYLNEQLQAIQKELGEHNEFRAEMQEIEEKLKTKKLSEEAGGKAQRELKKLKMMAPLSAEATVVRNYLDWIVSLPWQEYAEENKSLIGALRMLDEDHFGLYKVKERILEYLAVQILNDKVKGPILCFVGPPGVGKTSMGKSVARVTGRNFLRVSLGGVRDEAEIRGHRRTYIGALPGKIIQGMKRAGSCNPVFLLDEVDKMSSDYRGDPASALLEVLDPEHNHTFNDHYLDMDYDLSRVMFITTANTEQGIPPALRDRMEVLKLPGYTEDEKIAIARQFLVKKQKKANGLDDIDLNVSVPALKLIINRHTREAGVRNLEREIASICRKIARKTVERRELGERTAVAVRVHPSGVRGYLGVPKYRVEAVEQKDEVGLCTGLAWTEAGGDMLHIEVTVVPGSGNLAITGKLGDVMKESAQAALSYVRSRAERFGLAADFHKKVDVHIHVPEGAIPKDGPSAGVAMAVALISAVTRLRVRREVAMTGEITLRGRILPVGGLKEKLLAALRGGIKLVMIPEENKKDLEEIPANVLAGIEVSPVSHMDEVVARSFAVPDAEAVFGKAKAGREEVVFDDVSSIEEAPHPM